MKSKQHLSSAWVDTKSAAAVLGCSIDHLFHLRDGGLFKVGTHWRDIRRPGAARATYRWHVERCAKTLERPPEKRG